MAAGHAEKKWEGHAQITRDPSSETFRGMSDHSRCASWTILVGQTIVNWLSGKTPMLASHWSRIAARMLESESSPVVEAE